MWAFVEKYPVLGVMLIDEAVSSRMCKVPRKNQRYLLSTVIGDCSGAQRYAVPTREVSYILKM